MSDLDYLRSRVRPMAADEEEEEAESEAEESEEEEEAEEAEAEEAGEPAAAAADGAEAEEAAAAASGRLFVRNLPFTASEEELSALFSQHGELSSVRLLSDAASGHSKGLAYVQFADAAAAAAARARLDGCVFQGRLLHLLAARRPPGEPAPAPEPAAGGAFKAAKEQRLRAAAGDAAAWSALFVRPDTVAAFLAQRYAVDRADVMQPGAADAAVRLALGEAQLVAETKRELAAAGCDPGRLEAAAAGGGAGARVRRSATALLLKNLPFSADEGELRALAARFGQLARLLLPSTRALALLEYHEPSAARAAFAGLAYTRYQHVPLYVEWAPEGLLGAAPAPAPAPGPAPAAPAPAPAAAAEEEDGASLTLFVKNLAWATSDEALLAHFARALPGGLAALRSARVSRRPGVGRAAGQLVSAGFGFVECASGAAAAAALRLLDGSTLDGHALKLQRSRGAAPAAAAEGGGEAEAPRAAAAGGTKLVVRNVAFEATKQDIRALFAPFGQVKSLRLPRKFDGAHRGFAFVELTTRAEAREAFAAVGQTHLYGRRLVTEWANEEDGTGAEEVRAKTAARYAAEGEPGRKRKADR